MSKLKEYREHIGYILFFITLIGFGINIGVNRAEMQKLKDDVKHSNELWENQISINTKLETIVEILLSEE